MESKMNTNDSTPSTPKTPKNPARGNQQGQTTFAARIDRWEAMANNLLPLLEDMPQLKQVHAELQQTIADAKTLRDHVKSMQGEIRSSTAERKGVITKGEGLFSLLAFGLRFAFGPNSQRLNAFAVKPHGKPGRPGTTPPPPPPVPEAPTAPEAHASPAAPKK
jgi:hypothetical protein